MGILETFRKRRGTETLAVISIIIIRRFATRATKPAACAAHARRRGRGSYSSRAFVVVTASLPVYGRSVRNGGPAASHHRTSAAGPHNVSKRAGDRPPGPQRRLLCCCKHGFLAIAHPRRCCGFATILGGMGFNASARRLCGAMGHSPVLFALLMFNTTVVAFDIVLWTRFLKTMKSYSWFTSQFLYPASVAGTLWPVVFFRWATGLLSPDNWKFSEEVLLDSCSVRNGCVALTTAATATVCVEPDMQLCTFS